MIAAMPWKLTVRAGPRVERSTFAGNTVAGFGVNSTTGDSTTSVALAHNAFSRNGSTVGDDELEGDGLAAAGFPADEHVPLGQGDMGVGAHFVGAQVHRLPDRQRRLRHGGGCHGFTSFR